MKKFVGLVLFIALFSVLMSQSVSVTYTQGDIPSDMLAGGSEPGATDWSMLPGVLEVNIPAGMIVTGVDVQYTMTSANYAYINEQRSRIRCISDGGESEPLYIEGIGGHSGSYVYQRNGLSIANNVTTETIIFELHAFRTYGGSGISLNHVKVDNNSWTVTVHYANPGGEPQLLVNPDSKNYGELLVNMSLGQIFTLTNFGGGVLNIENVIITGEDAQFFNLNADNLNTTLNTSESTTLGVVYQPTEIGQHIANLSITDDTGRLVHNIPLQGNCIDPTITEFPHFQNFDNVSAGELPLGWTKIISPQGTGLQAQVAHSNLAPSAPHILKMYCVTGLNETIIVNTPPVNEINTKRLRFKAKGMSPYDIIIGTTNDIYDADAFIPLETVTAYSGYQDYIINLNNATHNIISIKHGASGYYQEIHIDDLIIEFLPQNAVYYSNTSEINLGNLYVNTVATFSYEVSNNGLSDLNLVYVIPENISMESNEIIIPGGQSQIITFTFDAQDVGVYNESILITTNDTDNQEVSISLTANILPALPEGLVEIGNGNTTLTNLPINPFYGYNYSQTIYLQEEINYSDSQITKIYYYWNGVQDGDNYKDWNVYIGHTNLSNFENNVSWIDVSTLNLVFSGEVEITAEEGWIEIILDQPFIYNNNDNIVIAVNEITPGFGSNSAKFLGTGKSTSRALRLERDNAVFDPDNLGVGILVNGIANIRLFLEQADEEPVIEITPDSLDFGTVIIGSQYTEIISISNQGTSIFEISNIDITGNEYFILTNLPDFPVLLNVVDTLHIEVSYSPLSQGTHQAHISIVNSLNEDTYTVDITGNAEEQCFAPPSNLIATIEENNVFLTWEQPYRVSELQGYNVYRNEILLNSTPVEDTDYSDFGLENGSYIYYVKAVYTDGISDSVTVNVEIDYVSVDDSVLIPQVIALTGNYPNPFNPSTTIKLSLPDDENVRIEIFNSKGQKIKTLVNDRLKAGFHNIFWDGKDENNKVVCSGVYFYRMQTKNYSNTKRMLLIK